MRTFRLLLAAALWTAALPLSAGPITLNDLLDEMVRLEPLTELPDPPFTCRQFSSYDRASKAPDQPGWFANGDVNQYLRVEEKDGRREFVMMDADGPGAVVRIWSANPKGTLRIYLDGEETPALEAPMADLLGGKFPGLPDPISGVRSAGWNLYFPIPYRKHCKITSDENGFYYHVNYRTWPEGTAVETFSVSRIGESADRIQQVVDALKSPRVALAPRDSDRRREFRLVLPPGRPKRVVSLRGPGEIVEWTARILEPNGSGIDDALRRTVVGMSFDGESCVETPLGDFFGAAPGIVPYESLPLGMTSEGVMWSHWPMPYRKGAVITLTNYGDAPVRIEGTVVARRRPWTERSCHFHAVWKSELDIPTRPRSDWTFVAVEGAGRYVGNALYVTNPRRRWWGEGDEKIYVDGETFPSHFGTGSEDYYGYAWCNPGTFEHAYHNQPRCDGPGNFGHTAVNRWHVLDSIPFTTSFRFDMEVWHHEDTTVSLQAVSFYYGRPGCRDSAVGLTPEMLVIPEPPELKVYVVPGAIEGESMRVVSSTRGKARPQSLAEKNFSRERHLWWTDASVGDELVLAFPSEEAGPKEILAGFCTASDYGIVEIAVNDDPPGDPIDLYNDKVAARGPVSLGVHELRKGDNLLRIRIVGANPAAKPAHMFGLDYLLLKD